MNRTLSVCLAYYENPSMLDFQIRAYCLMPRELRKGFELVVVDDGSPARPAEPVIRKLGFKIPFGFQLYRMGVDIPWNQDACRNLAVSKATHGWVLLTDMDHIAPWRTIEAVRTKDLSERDAHKFSRVNAPDFDYYKPHPNSWLMTRNLYDTVGGYDERYAGIYGTDGPFGAGVARAARRVVAMAEPIVRYSRDVIPDASTTTLTRRSEANTAAALARTRELAESLRAHPRPKRGLFPWERVV